MSRDWTIGFVALAIVTLISVVYAFVQTVKAENAERSALEQKMLSDQAGVMADRNAAEAQRQNQLYESCRQQLQQCQSSK